MKDKTLTKQKKIIKGVIMLGIVLLLLPLFVPAISDYSDFFKFSGNGLMLSAFVYLLFLRYPQNIFISDNDLSKLKALELAPTTKASFPKISISTLILIILVGVFLLNQILIWQMGASGNLSKPFSINIDITKKK